MVQGSTNQARIADFRVRFHKRPRSRLFAPLADLLRQAGEFEEALMLLEEGLVRYPDYPSAMIVLGQTLFDSGRGGHARRVLQRVLTLDPENLVALQALATDAVDRGDLNDAVPLLEQLVGQDPDDRHWTRMLARCRRELMAPGSALPPAPAPPGPDPSEAEAEPPAVGTEGVFATMTLVDIYLTQGYRTKALRALRRMADRYPEATDIQQKLREVESLGVASPGAGAQPPRPSPPVAGNSRRASEKQQFQAWLDRLEPGENEAS